MYEDLTCKPIPMSLRDPKLEGIDITTLPWKKVVVTKLIKREEFLYRGDTHGYDFWGKLRRSPTVSHKYVRLPEGLVRDHNVCVVYKTGETINGFMLIFQNAAPAFTKPISIKKPEIFEYFHWTPFMPPSKTKHQDALLLSPEKEQEFEERKRRWSGLPPSNHEPTTQVKYYCSGGEERDGKLIPHTTLRDFDAPPLKDCPRCGAVMLQNKPQQCDFCGNTRNLRPYRKQKTRRYGGKEQTYEDLMGKWCKDCRQKQEREEV